MRSILYNRSCMILLSIFALAIIVIILWDAFETIILPRRVNRRIRLARIFYRSLWKLWKKGIKLFKSPSYTKNFLSFFGPLSLVLLLEFWTISLIMGFALLNFGLQDFQSKQGDMNFLSYLFASGETFFPVGLVDSIPHEPLARFICIIEAGTGLALLAMVIGYFPVLYQGFSRREVNINLLDSRAGSPPNALYFLQQYSEADIIEELKPQLERWEEWCAELLETHISYPVLAYYRSQHDNQSWIAALLMILDSSAIILASKNKILHTSAKSTFAIARHAAVDLTQAFFLIPHSPSPDRLPSEDYKELRNSLKNSDISLKNETESETKLNYLRKIYEPYIYSLSNYFLMPITPFILKTEIEEAWRRTV